MTLLKTKNIQYIDTLRTLAIIGVVIIHVATPVLNMNYSKNIGFWWIGLFFDSAVRYAVPIFLVLSGVTMLGKEYDLLEFYKKRFSRVLIPFLFWLPTYWVFRWFMLRPHEQVKDFQEVLQWAANLYMKEGVSVHLWYVYMIMFLYLLLPFISKILLKCNKNTILIILFIWLIINTLQSFKLLSVDYFPFILKKIYGYALYAGYLVLGYYLKITTFNSSHTKLIAWSGFIFTIFIASIPSYFISLDSGKQNLIFLGTFNLNTLMQTVAIFYIFKDSIIKNKYMLQIINTISNFSFGVYLVHVIVLSIFFRIGIFWTMAHPIISIPIVVIMTLITSMLIIYTMKKIPGLKLFT